MLVTWQQTFRLFLDFLPARGQVEQFIDLAPNSFRPKSARWRGWLVWGSRQPPYPCRPVPLLREVHLCFPTCQPQAKVYIALLRLTRVLVRFPSLKHSFKDSLATFGGEEEKAKVEGHSLSAGLE